MRMGFVVLCMLVLAAFHVHAVAAPRSDTEWQVGTPIVTYYAGPSMTPATARQMAEGGFNLVWCGETELDGVHAQGLRGMLRDGLLIRETVDDPAQAAKLDALIERVKDHPAMYAYYIIDEPSAAVFPALGKLVAYLRERDPAHMAYINLFPTYANNEQLGTAGDTVTAYKDHLRQYLDIVKPDLISYDHYHFTTANGDNDQYFLNLALIREAALNAGLPFLNIVQACSWDPYMRVPNGSEVRFLVYTSLAYGAMGISYYVYYAGGHVGGIAYADGTPTPLHHALRRINREFAAIAGELQPLTSLGVYHLGMVPWGGVGLPADACFTVDPPVPTAEYKPPAPIEGMVLGYFGPQSNPTHVVVVNLDYSQAVVTEVVGPGPLQVFNPRRRVWRPSLDGSRAKVHLMAGGGKLLRLAGGAISPLE